MGVDSQVTALLQDTGIRPAFGAAFTARPYPRIFRLKPSDLHTFFRRRPLGSFVRGGGSLLFGDVLGERKLAMEAAGGNHLRDLDSRCTSIERRWNWGAIAEVQLLETCLPRAC